jgi:hypothetical protein
MLHAAESEITDEVVDPLLLKLADFRGATVRRTENGALLVQLVVARR